MFIDGVTNADSLPTLRAAVGFAAARQPIITHNIANLSTPNYRAKDVSTEGFQAELRRAIGERRDRWGGQRGEMMIHGTRDVQPIRGGNDGFALSPKPIGRGVLFHDRNDRDLERTMQDLTENVAYFRVSIDLLRSRVSLMNAAIAERV